MRKEILFLTGLVLSALVFGVLVSAYSDEAPATASVTVSGFISLDISPGTIEFGDMDPGIAPVPATNNPLTVTIGDETNVNYHILTGADEENFCIRDSNDVCLTGTGAGAFDVGQMEWALETGTYHDYSTTSTEVTVGAPLIPAADQAYHLNHRLTVPLGQKEGTYSVGVTITAST